MIPIEHGMKAFDTISTFCQTLLVKMLQVWIAWVRFLAKDAILVFV